MGWPPDSAPPPRRKRGLPPVIGGLLRDADNQNRRTSQSKGYQEVQPVEGAPGDLPTFAVTGGGITGTSSGTLIAGLGEGLYLANLEVQVSLQADATPANVWSDDPVGFTVSDSLHTHQFSWPIHFNAYTDPAPEAIIYWGGAVMLQVRSDLAPWDIGFAVTPFSFSASTSFVCNFSYARLGSMA